MNSAEQPQTAPLPAEAQRRSLWPKIVGFISAGIVLLLLAAIMIPCLLVEPRAANESSAVSSLRTIANAQHRFFEDHPERGFARSLSELGPSGANEIDVALASGTRSCYVFTLTPTAPDSSGRVSKYAVTARPQKFGNTGTRSFFMDETGFIRHTPENRPATASDPPLS